MEPISVTITNNTSEGRIIRWLAKGNKWIDPKASITVDYDPWSCADGKQREAMLAALSRGDISLLMHVVTVDCEIVTLKYNPAALKSVGQRIVTPAPIVTQAPVNNDVTAGGNDNHIVVAKGAGNNYAKSLGLTVEEVAPPSADINHPAVNGFVKEAAAKAEGRAVVTDSTSEYASKVEAEIMAGAIVEDKPIEPRYAEGLVTSGGYKIDLDDDERVKYAFIEFIDNKQWQNALELLKSKFGEDKITFTTRAIMASKDYDAIVAKYKLAD